MRRISTMQLIPGMIAAEDVYSFGNQLLISKDTVLSDTAIIMLDMHDIVSIRIDDRITAPAAKVQEKIPAAVFPMPDLSLPYSVRTRRSPEFRSFKAKYNNSIDRFKLCLDMTVQKKLPLDTNDLYMDVMSFLEPGANTFHILNILNNIREYDDSTYSHSLNVAFICNVLARWLRMPENAVRLATACGLFHDVGKIMVPQGIIQKPAGLSDEEFEIVRRHSASGYQLLMNLNIDRRICNAALMHHERCDGTGYPLGLTAAQIDPMAKLVAIADVYDAMTAARIYRGPICPFKVIEMFELDGLQKYEPRFIMTFLQNIVETYVSNRCRLNNGLEGEIILINKDRLSRPIIQCGKKYINLAQERELYIECLL